jgi:ribosomal protein L11 methyltransferase
MSENSKFWQASFFLPSQTSETLAAEYLDCFEGFAHSSFLRMEDDGRFHLELMFKGAEPPVSADILAHFRNFGTTDLKVRDIDIAEVPEKNWLVHVYEDLPPFHIGRFFIYGHHYTGEIPQGVFPVQIHAAEAFGSGEHDTTQGCILSVEALAEQGIAFRNILDMGCGSGILALGAACLWPQAIVTAVDIEEDAVRVTENHAHINGFQYRLHCAAGAGYATPLAQKNAPYDLVLANILSNVLIDLAAELAAVLAPGGYAVLAGLLTRQMQDVLAAHEKHGLELVAEREQGGWSILTLKKPA